MFSIYVVSLNTSFFLLIWFGSVAFLAVEMAHYFSMTRAACLFSIFSFDFIVATVTFEAFGFSLRGRQCLLNCYLF